jgi:cytochrome c2
MKNVILILGILIFTIGCGGGSTETNNTSKPKPKSMIEKASKADPKGVGTIKKVALNNPLDEGMIKRGSAIYDLKCAACHKLSDKRVVGPGWKGITSRRTPEWIMNMTINVEEMLDKDPAAKELLKECLVRMPNQNLKEDEARDVLEFMLKNDAE